MNKLTPFQPVTIIDAMKSDLDHMCKLIEGECDPSNRDRSKLTVLVPDGEATQEYADWINDGVPWFKKNDVWVKRSAHVFIDGVLHVRFDFDAPTPIRWLES